MRHLIDSRKDRPNNDPIFALNAAANAKKAAGESVVNATLGALMNDDGSLTTFTSVMRALREVPDAEWAAYAPIAGVPAFLDAVIHDVLGEHPALKACATASATPGGSGALRHAITSHLDVGQALLTPSLYWGPYQTLCDENERKLETFNMFVRGADGHVIGLDVAAMEAAIVRQLQQQGRVLLFLNDPCNNPTGYSMSDAEWQAVVEVLLRYQTQPVTLLVDMAYWMYGARANPRAFLSALEPLIGHVGLLFAWSASKSFAQYGLRVGALIGCAPVVEDRQRLAAAWSYASRGTWSNCVRGGQVAITRLLTDATLAKACAEEREHHRRVLRGRVDAFNHHAAQHGLVYPRYEGGFFVTVLCDDPQGLSARMRDHNVFVVPQAGAVRVALCSVAAHDVERLVAALAL